MTTRKTYEEELNELRSLDRAEASDGYRRDSEHKSAALLRNRVLTLALCGALVALVVYTYRLSVIRSQLAQLATDNANLRAERKKLRDQTDDLELKNLALVQKSSLLSTLESTLRMREQDRKTLQDSLTLVKGQSQEAQRRRAQLSAQIAQADRTLRDLTSERDSEHARVQQLQAETHQLEATISDANIQLLKREGELKASTQSAREKDSRIQELGQELDSTLQENRKLASDGARIIADFKHLQETVDAANRDLAACREQLKTATSHASANPVTGGDTAKVSTIDSTGSAKESKGGQVQPSPGTTQ